LFWVSFWEVLEEEFGDVWFVFLCGSYGFFIGCLCLGGCDVVKTT